jgi:hypothetical protein
MLNAEIGVGCGSAGECGGSGGCSGAIDFCIKRYDTRPSFKVSVSDCDGVVDLTDENLALEASMWFVAKLKSAINESSVTISFADNVGFDQILVGDTIVMDRVRSPENMVVSAINEVAKTITVLRARNNTVAQIWPRGNSLKVFRFVDSAAEIESVFGDVTQVDGTLTNELLDTFLVFNWSGNQTQLPGCYRMEFKLLMISSSTAEIEWTKRFPLNSDGFIINVVDSATTN